MAIDIKQIGSGFGKSLGERLEGEISKLGFNKKPSSRIGENDFTSKTIYYPNEVVSESIPLIMFTAHYKKQSDVATSIVLPCPGAIAVNDTASYGSVDRQAFSGITTDVLRRVLGGEAGDMAQEIKAANNNPGELTVAVASLIANKVASDYVDAMWANKVITNPNTVTTFTSNGFRSYTYNFTLTPRSYEEAEQINDMIQAFRKFTYAGTESSSTYSFFLKYPPVWTIKYLLGQELKENPYIARPFTCYLQSFSSTYNATAGSSYYINGQPVDTQISMTFQETRVLYQGDIDNLQSGIPLNVKYGAGAFDLGGTNVFALTKDEIELFNL